MPHALRFTACTLNLWKEERLEARRPAIAAFARAHRPDVLCVQELRAATRELLDRSLPDHARIEDPFPGFTDEGTIFWCRELFRLDGHGAEDVGILEPHRRLFWARLLPPGGGTLLVATAHFTWPEHPDELRTGRSPRIDQARRTAAALARLRRPGEPLLFMGDLNATLHPVRVLRAAGLRTCFEGLGRTPPPTFPTLPTGAVAPKAHGRRTIDWLLYQGPLAPMSCDVVELFADGVAPSDHHPVIATFRLEAR